MRVHSYKRNDDGKVRICLHHSSVPYSKSSATVEGKPIRKSKMAQSQLCTIS